MKKNIDECDLESELESVKPLPVAAQRGAGVFGGTFNLANSALGAGLLTFPNSFSLAGLSASLCLQGTFALLTFITVVIFSHASNITSASSLTVIMSRLYGKWANFITTILLIAFAWFGCIAYLTVIGTQLEIFGRIADGVQEGCPVHWYMDPTFTTAVVGTVIVYPLAVLPDMSNLAWASFVAIAACWYVTAFVIISYFIYESPRGILDAQEQCFQGDKQEFHDVTFWTFITAIPATCFGYHCQIPSIPNYSELLPKARAVYPYMAFAAATVCFVTYSSVGVFGLMTFGGCAASKKLILDNYPTFNQGANIGRVFIALAVATSYPVVGFCGRQELNKFLEAICTKRGFVFTESNVFLGSSGRRLFWLGTFWYITTLMFAIFVPDITMVITFTGMICAVSIFIYPGMILMKMAYLWQEETIEDAIKNLPEAPREDLADSWACGMRNRVPYWLTSTQQRIMWWIGVIFIGLGILLLGICVYTFLEAETKPIVPKMINTDC